MKLNVAFAKLVMGLVRQNPDVSDEDALAFLQYNQFDVRNAVDEVVVTKEQIRDITKALAQPIAGLQIGDEVEVTFNKETVLGPIKSVKYQVEGAGSKQYEAKDIKKL